MQAEVARRAFEKWLARSRGDASPLQDWLEAEDEVRQRQETIRLLTEAEKRLLVEHEVSRILSVACSLDEACLKVVQVICESLGWDLGELWLVERNSAELRCFAGWHSSHLEAAAFAQAAQALRLSSGKGIAGRVWARRSPLWLSDMTGEADLQRAGLAAAVGLHGAVALPLATASEFLGVVVFFSAEIRPADEHVIETMTSVLLNLTQFVERRQAEEKLRRQEVERGIAREVQQGLLPKTMPRIAGFKIGARSLAAAEVGGDCFDFFPSQVDGRENLDVLIADASGHGMAAALLMAETRAYVRALALTCVDPGRLLDLTNTRLTEDLLPGHFVTLFLLRLDPEARLLRYAGAGHWPAYVLDRRGVVREVLTSSGEPVGIDARFTCSTGPAIALHDGDLVFLFTDGVVEAASPGKELFGVERALEVIRTHRRHPPEEILEVLFRALSEFTQSGLQDDATAVVLQAEAREG